jgi:hypothetical protein
MWLASGWRSDNNQALLELSDFARGRIGFSRVVCFGRFYLSGVYCVCSVSRARRGPVHLWIVLGSSCSFCSILTHTLFEDYVR